MNYGQMEVPLQAFAPNAIEDRDDKLKTLNEEIEAKLAEVTKSLRKVDINVGLRDRGNYGVAKKKLVEFLDWRWKKQTAWLRKELGEEKTNELIGDPILIGYSFLIEGDPDTRHGADAFGGPPWGGSLYSSHTTGMSSSEGNGVRHVTLGVGNFDPTTGKIREVAFDHNNRYGRLQGPKPPVRVPGGMTVAVARKRLAELQEKVVALSEETAASIQALRQVARNAPPAIAGRNFRVSIEQQRQIEADLSREASLLQIDIIRWQRIIEELGADPNESQKAIRSARLLFLQSQIFRCDSPTFLANIDARAEQCDALDEIAADLGAPNMASTADMVKWLRLESPPRPHCGARGR